MQVAAEIRECLHTSIETGVLTLLRAARPHPVGREAQRIHSVGQRSPNDVCQSLSNRQNRTCSRVSQTSLRRMTKSGCDTLLATIVEGYYTTVAQWQLYLTLALLTSNLTCYRTVYLIGQPVLTSHSLQLQYTVEVFINLILAVGHVLIVTFYSIIFHNGLW